MFTGIVQETGSVEWSRPEEGGLRMRILAGAVASRLAPGGSVAVSGVCLSAETVEAGGFTVFCTAETLARTSFGRAAPGAVWNLELPLRLGDPLGGHWVQGHVDAVGSLRAVREEGGDSRTVVFGLPAPLRRYLVEKGSVAVEGISLTVAGFESVGAESGFRVAVIPETWRRTNLRSLSPGDPVHLEVDILAKYVESLLGLGSAPSREVEGRITGDFLREHGFA